MRTCATQITLHGERATPRRDGSLRARSVRRGVASMLVIVSVAVVTVMTLAFLHSQDAAPDVTANIITATQARYIAESGADLAAALMEIETIDWREVHSSGVVLNNYAFGGGRLNLNVYDLNGDPPDLTTEHVVVRATGKVNGVKQTAVADVYAPLMPVGGADIDLSEFALFGDESVRVDDGRLTRWYHAPEARLGQPLRVGSNGISGSSVEFRSTSRLIDTVVCLRGTASADAIRNDTSFDIKRVDLTLSEPLPVPAGAAPSVNGMLWAPIMSVTVSSNRTMDFSDDRRFVSITINSGAILRTTAVGSRKILIDGNLTIQDSSAWVIEGNLDLIVLGDLTVRNSSGLVNNGTGRLRVFPMGEVLFDRGALGFSRVDVQDITDAQLGMDEFKRNPRQTQMYRISSYENEGDPDLIGGLLGGLLGGSTPADQIPYRNDPDIPTWMFTNQSFVCGVLYGSKTADVEVNGNSGVFGCVSGRQVRITGASAVHYDHGLDDRLGYTNPNTHLYSAPQTLNQDIVSLAVDLSEATLAAIGSVVNSLLGLTVDLLGGLLGGGSDPEPSSSTEPSPRDEARVAWMKLRQVGMRPTQDADPVAEMVAPRRVAAVSP